MSPCFCRHVGAADEEVAPHDEQKPLTADEEVAPLDAKNRGILAF